LRTCSYLRPNQRNTQTPVQSLPAVSRTDCARHFHVPTRFRPSGPFHGNAILFDNWRRSRAGKPKKSGNLASDKKDRCQSQQQNQQEEEEAWTCSQAKAHPTAKDHSKQGWHPCTMLNNSMNMADASPQRGKSAGLHVWTAPVRTSSVCSSVCLSVAR
jgi:hypothetical protein